MIRVFLWVKEERTDKLYYEFTACQYSIDKRKNILSTRMNHLAKDMRLHFEDLQIENDNGILKLYVTVTEEEYNNYDSSRG